MGPDLRIAGVGRGAGIRFRFEDREVEAHEGESVAAALWAAGVRHWNSGDGGAQPPARTLFCAMGVCQQCALWIDGRRVESCRVPVRAGLDVRIAQTDVTPDATLADMAPDPEDFDVVVLGAGPAGAAAAIEAHARGLRVALVDEGAVAGGQVFRVAPGIGSVDPERGEGAALRAEIAALDIARWFDARVWCVERIGDRWLAHFADARGARTLRAQALILATGAQERHLPFAGWDRPGVIGLAAATVLIKAQRMLPGRDVIVAGAGPLLLLVAKSIVEGGGRVVAVVDTRPRAAWLAEGMAMASRPDLVARGLRWRRTLRRHGVPFYASHLVHRVTGDAPSLSAHVVALDRDGKPRSDVPSFVLQGDALCCGFGLMPATDASRLVGAAHAYAPARGGWHVEVDDDQRCDRPHLFAAGDGAGVVGAAAAPWQGRIAAIAAARALGRVDDSAYRLATAPMKRKRAAAARFGSAMTRIASVADATLAAIAPGTLVCQCEGLTRATLDTAIDEGCVTLNDLKTATRCGMGPCGGRLCEDAAARLVAIRAGRTREAVGQVTGRPPLRPVELDRLAGAFDYDALPMAAPAPL